MQQRKKLYFKCTSSRFYIFTALKVASANQQTVVYLHIQTRSNMFMYLESCFCPNDSFKYYIHLNFGSATIKKYLSPGLNQAAKCSSATCEMM